MKIHHIGIVCEEDDLKNYFFLPEKKFIYFDKKQNNKLVIGKNKYNNLWMEFVIPLNSKSTVKNFLKTRGSAIHHIAYYVKDINKIKREFKKKTDFLYVNSYKIEINCFGGLLETVFFYNSNIFIEFLSKAKKR
ncbi:VOC family protein [Candidatus Pelagibacter sp. HIMB1483]|uniref:VOC family protein n=1 Tax=Candidatus Pelagibacter sp. HIMB1483 TaxID=3415414 RepID=UPI003F863E14